MWNRNKSFPNLGANSAFELVTSFKETKNESYRDSYMFLHSVITNVLIKIRRDVKIKTVPSLLTIDNVL